MRTFTSRTGLVQLLMIAAQNVLKRAEDQSTREIRGQPADASQLRGAHREQLARIQGASQARYSQGDPLRLSNRLQDVAVIQTRLQRATKANKP